MKPLRFQRLAEAEFEDALGYYAQIDADLSIELRSKVESILALVQQHPGLGSPVKGTPYRKCVLRRFPYNVFYWDREDTVWVMAVAHQKRRPGYWMNRIID